MAKLGDISLFIEKESERYRVEATEYAVERGEPFTDHVAKRPDEFTISGFILEDDWENSRDRLKEYMNSGTVLKYIGKTSVSNVIILEMPIDHDANGTSISVILRRIRITTSSWVKANPKDIPQQKSPTNSGKKKTVSNSSKPSNNKEVYHVTKAGDTYWGLSKKYGTSITQLKAWNKWEATKIPIGQKARVK
jgi:LysM repeat protein